MLVLILAGAGSIVIFSLYNQPTQATLNVRNGATEVPVDTHLVVGLTRPSTAKDFYPHFAVAPATDGNLTASRDGLSFIWTPTQPLLDLAQYTVQLYPFQDSTGHQVAPRTWTFTTTILPRVTGLQADSGGSIAQGAQVSLQPKLKLLFNDAMKTSTVKLLVGSTPAQLTWDADDKSAHFTLTNPPGQVRLSLGPGGRDLKGRALSTNWHLALTLVFTVDEPTTPLPSPVIIQVPNDPNARDQSGLQAADMVFEYVTEGGIRRLSALFTHVPKTVGPIRSGRLISFKLTRHYHAMLFFSGLSDGSRAALNADPVPTFGDTVGYTYRSSDRYPPDNLYIGGDGITRAQALMNLPPYSLPAQAAPSTAGWQAANTLTVDEHNSQYQYDPATATYLKFEDDFQRPLYDALIGQPLHAAMVIVVHTTETPTPFIEDVNGAHGTDFDMQSGGAAEIYYQGLATQGHWASPDRAAPLVFTDAAGKKVSMPPGLVWVDVVR